MATAQTVDQDVQSVAPVELLGHPIGLFYLFTTEMWERFSYYGMRAILVLYLTNLLLLEPTSASVIGHDAMKSLFEALTGSIRWFGLSLVSAVSPTMRGTRKRLSSWMWGPIGPSKSITSSQVS